MSLLNEILDDVKNGKTVTEDWSFLSNTYFPGPEGFKDLKKWAASNNIIAVPDNITEESFDYIKFSSITFRAKT